MQKRYINNKNKEKTMAKNNYFNYVDFHNQNYFLIYLLSFAMDEYKDDDPLLSECAKELIRYILGMDKTENVIVTEYDGEDTFIVNHNKCILIDQFPPYTKPILNLKREEKLMKIGRKNKIKAVKNHCLDSITTKKLYFQ